MCEVDLLWQVWDHRNCTEEANVAKRYSAKFKFQVITELLTGDKSTAQVAKVYGVHPNTVNAWKRTFLEKGPEIFAQDNLVAEYERRIADLERLIGRKEVEIALLKNFLGRPR
jgi:transposase-like protein